MKVFRPPARTVAALHRHGLGRGEFNCPDYKGATLPGNDGAGRCSYGYNAGETRLVILAWVVLTATIISGDPDSARWMVHGSRKSVRATSNMIAIGDATLIW